MFVWCGFERTKLCDSHKQLFDYHPKILCDSYKSIESLGSIECADFIDSIESEDSTDSIDSIDFIDSIDSILVPHKRPPAFTPHTHTQRGVR